VQRGFAYLDGRLFRGTSDAHVIALDAADGHTLWDRAMERPRRRRLDADGSDRLRGRSSSATRAATKRA
jgi:glucose dehydrogenase